MANKGSCSKRVAPVNQERERERSRDGLISMDSTRSHTEMVVETK
jgi:hypothetical protein